MRDIERFQISGEVYTTPFLNGEWVRYADHLMETTRLTGQNSKYWAEIERLKNAIDHLTSERDAARGEVERLKEQVAALTVAVEQADEMKAHAEAAAAAEEAETDRVMAERDAAQAKVERLKNAIDHLTSERDEARVERDAAQRERDRVQDLLTLAGRELSTLRESLRQPRRDQSAQNLDMGNGQAILDSSRPTDEDIWRHAFTAALQSPHFNRTKMADEVLAEYRKRWPR